MKQIGEMEERAEKTLEKLSSRFAKNKDDGSNKKLSLAKIKEQLNMFKKKYGQKNNLDTKEAERNSKDSLENDPTAKSITGTHEEDELDSKQEKPKFFEGSFEEFLEEREEKKKTIEGDSNEAAIETEANKQKKDNLQVGYENLSMDASISIDKFYISNKIWLIVIFDSNTINIANKKIRKQKPIIMYKLIM